MNSAQLPGPMWIEINQQESSTIQQDRNPRMQALEEPAVLDDDVQPLARHTATAAAG
jgi:hypothetical protein